ncbi:MAG: hypothetical protein ACRDZ3_05950 [Acidimicrobiia bacterium]
MTTPTRIVSVLSGAALSLGLVLGAAPAAHAGGGHGKAEFRHQSSGSGARAEWSQGRSQSDPDGDSNGGKDKPGFRGGFDEDRDGNNGCGNDADREDDNNGNCGRIKDRSEAEVQAVRDWWAFKVRLFKERAPEVRAAWLAAVERCRDEAGMDDDDDPIDTEVEAVVVAKECKCDEAEEIVSTAGVVPPAVTTVDAEVVVTPAPTVETPAPAAETPPAEVAGTVETAAAADPATTTTTAPPTTSTTVPTEVLGISETAPDTLARTGAGLGFLALAAGLCLGAGRLLHVLKGRLDA